MLGARRIFISYRRSETDGAAALMHARLGAAFGAGGVFMDQAGLRAGDDYRQRIVRELGHCDVLVALVGKGWRGVSRKGEPSRLHEAEDYVRFEVGMALDRGILVIPVLVNDVPDLQRHELPDLLWKLTTLERIRLVLNQRPDDAIARIVKAIKADRARRWAWIRYAAIGGGAIAMGLSGWWWMRQADGHAVSPEVAVHDTIRPPTRDTVAPEPQREEGEARAIPTERRAEAPERPASLPCAIAGVEFVAEPFSRDRMMIVQEGRVGRYRLSGMLDGRSVQGRLKVSGASLLVQLEEGSDLLGGALALDADCRHLTGSLQLRSIRSGATVTVPVRLYDKAKGR